MKHKNTLIGMVSSTSSEGHLFIKNLKISDKMQLRFYTGNSFGKDLVYAVSGIGKANASHAATLLIEKYNPSLVINFGIGGAYPSAGLKVGDIAIAEKEVYGDEGVFDKKGFQGMRKIGIPLLKKEGRKYFNEFPLDKAFFKKAVKSFKLIIPHSSPLTPHPLPLIQCKSVTFVTVSTCSGTTKRALELEKKYDAICENMEGAAIAHICAMYGIPMLEIRGISNIVENRDIKKWDIKLASENCQKAVMEILNKL